MYLPFGKIFDGKLNSVSKSLSFDLGRFAIH
jgi:hypothetical protein